MHAKMDKFLLLFLLLCPSISAQPLWIPFLKMPLPPGPPNLMDMKSQMSERTCITTEEVPAEQALQRARSILGMGRSKDAKTQKELMQLMIADPGFLEAALRKNDSDYGKFDEKELAKTLGEDRLDLSVVATIVQDKDRFNKIAPNVREKIMYFILRERLKGRFFLLVDTDHLRANARGSVLYYKRVRDAVLYSLLFLLIGCAWLIFLDGSTHYGFVTEELKDEHNFTQALTVIENFIKTRGKYFYVRVWSNHHNNTNFENCTTILVTEWSGWIPDDEYGFCGQGRQVRYRTVLVEDDSFCPPSHICRDSPHV